MRLSRDRADRQRVAGRIARKGALQSGPYGGGIFAAVAEQSGRAMCLRAGWPARVPCNPAPTNRVSIHRNPQGFGRQGCVCGRGVPRPYRSGTVCSHRGTGVVRRCSCGPDGPRGCPAIRPLQMGEYLRLSRDRADRQRVAGRIARKGALQSGPYGGGIFAAVAEQSGRAMCLRAGWPARVPCNPAPTNRVSIHRNPQGFGQQGCAYGRGVPRPYE